MKTMQFMRKRWFFVLLVLLLFAVTGISFAQTDYAAESEKVAQYYGDVDQDGEVTAKDALRVLKHVVKLELLPEDGLVLADMDRDESITAKDALEILKTTVRLIEKVEVSAGVTETPEPTEAPSPTPEPTLEPVTYYVPEVMEKTENQGIGFPGADGYGKETTGGRGGKVYEVTNLNDSGEGSLRAALEASGPRIVVFKVSGTIYLKSRITIKNGDLTVAGQTAPGDGICLANYGLVLTRANNVIIRYIRVRPGDQGAIDGSEEDGIWVQACKDVILDHCSVSWGVDETLSVSPAGKGIKYEDVSDRVSVQWCMISESITISRLIGTRHGMGSLIRSAQGACVTFHHNYYSTHSSRMPMIGNYMDNDKDNGNFQCEFVNNVVYNWSSKHSGKCADADANGILEYTTNINYINNAFKKGPLSTNTYAFSEASIGNHMYISGNMMEGKVPEDQKTLVYFEDDVLASEKNPYYRASGKVIDQEAYFLKEPFANSKMTGIQSAQEAEAAVIAKAGASLGRDSVDSAQMEAYKSGNKGALIYSPCDSLGWEGEKVDRNVYDQDYFDWMQGKYPALKSYPGYIDTDRDGMSDDWETFMGLNPADATDAAAGYKDTAYTNLDVFLQFLVENPTASIAR